MQRLNITEKAPSELMIIYRKVLWMGITLLAPEFTALIAFDQWRKSRHVQEMHEVGLTWWMPIHGFYADMGGIVVKLSNDRPHFLAKQTGTTFETDEGTKYTIGTKDLRTLVARNILPLPRISRDSILDKSKTDNFAKSITAFQVLCFTIERFARLIQHMPIALLEISTLAFIACSAMILFFWWDKPLDVRTPMTFTIPPNKTDEFIRLYPELDRTPDEQEVAERLNYWQWYTDLVEHRKYKAKHALWIGSTFNSIHLAAWNHSFPTYAEKILWRVCSIGAWAAAILFFLTIFMRRGRLQWTLAIMIGIILALTSRCALIVGALIELRALPGKAYADVPWKDFLPHV